MLRALLLLILLGWPVSSLADDATILGPNATTPAARSTAQGQSGLVGPASPTSSTALQPTGTGQGSSLQSAASGGAGQAASSQTLQQVGDAQALKLFVQGEAPSTPIDDNQSSTPWIEYVLILAVALGAGGAAWWLHRRPAKQQSSEKSPH
jgi:hypothetical protein